MSRKVTRFTSRVCAAGLNSFASSPLFNPVLRSGGSMGCPDSGEAAGCVQVKPGAFRSGGQLLVLNLNLVVLNLNPVVAGEIKKKIKIKKPAD